MKYAQWIRQIGSCLCFFVYDELVENAVQGWLSKVRYHGSVLISLATLFAFSIHPVPWCFDCELPNPWGHVAGWADDVLTLWLLTAPFLAGVFALRMGWLVPVCM